MVNKLTIFPGVFLLRVFLPAAIIVILVFGVLCLVFEEVEKIYEYLIPFEKADSEITPQQMKKEEILNLEKD